MSANHNQKHVVLLGDWFIDENWLIKKHSSFTSSHTGEAHFLSDQKGINKCISSLCGASAVMEALRSYFELECNGQFGLLGYGVWHPDDNEILQCALCGKHLADKHLTPYILMSFKKPEDKRNTGGVRYCPYESERTACSYEGTAKLINLKDEKTNPTNRIIRTFKVEEGTFQQLHRFDWEYPKIDLKEEELEIKWDLRDKNVVAVIIVDHDRGVVNNRSVQSLINSLKENNDNDKFKKIKWYIRSTIYHPEWIKTLKEQIRLRLRVINESIINFNKGRKIWTFGETLGRDSLEFLNILTKENQNIICERAAIILNKNAAIAIDSTEEEDRNRKCYHVYDNTKDVPSIEIGRNTIFFSALIAQDLRTEEELDFGDQCWKALECAFQWCVNASNYFRAGERAVEDETTQHYWGSYAKALQSLEDIKTGRI